LVSLQPEASQVCPAFSPSVQFSGLAASVISIPPADPFSVVSSFPPFALSTGVNSLFQILAAFEIRHFLGLHLDNLPCFRVPAFVPFLFLHLKTIASLVFAQRMVKPIRTLQEGAARMGEGELGHRIELLTGDELETLGDEFNRMTVHLQESYAK
jgi:methyl-accepting chemotaxis protein